MITNERQHKIAKANIKNFSEALTRLAELPPNRKQPWVRSAQEESIKEQMDQLRKQINEYEMLKEGKIAIPDPVTAVSRTPLILIQSRIARGWDQEELANRLGMKKQQIQRYEQNNYQQATVSVLARVAAVLAESEPVAPQASKSEPRTSITKKSAKRTQNVSSSKKIATKRAATRKTAP